MSTTEAPNPVTAAAESESVRKARPEEHARVAEALTDAFYDDPVMGWFYPDDDRRADQLRGLFSFFGEKVWFPHDITYTTDNVAGAAVWEPPGKWKISMLRQLMLTPGLIRRTGLRDLPRGLRGLGIMEKAHPTYDHYYLPVIGVSSAWQGKGIGSALLKPMLERCDAEGIPAYLEATTVRNRACYERNGFVVTHEITLPDGPTMFGMRRDPVRAAGAAPAGSH
jgi:RimJ/RimL family protein N-acetyltransferase